MKEEAMKWQKQQWIVSGLSNVKSFESPVTNVPKKLGLSSNLTMKNSFTNIQLIDKV